MDLNKDGIIEWNEFLLVMSQWLQKSSVLSKQISINIGEVLPQEKKLMHLHMANFFTQFQKDSKNMNSKIALFAD